MHLVKGVSAFLRRSSPGHSRGDGDCAGDRLTAPSWPDIQFRFVFAFSFGNWNLTYSSTQRYWDGFQPNIRCNFCVNFIF